MTDLTGVTVIFDLDGTLVDTAPDLVRALNAVIVPEGYPPVPLDDVRHMVGRGARALLRRAYANAGTAIPEPRLSDKVGQFVDAYAADIARDSRLFAGALDCVGALAAAGATAVIATNKPQALTDQLLTALNIADRFARAVGADSVPAKKPDAAHLVAAAGSRAALKAAVMVGDSSVDVAAARNAGAPCVVLAHGYSESPFADLGADAVLDGFDGLEAAVRRLAGRA